MLILKLLLYFSKNYILRNNLFKDLLKVVSAPDILQKIKPFSSCMLRSALREVTELSLIDMFTKNFVLKGTTLKCSNLLIFRGSFVDHLKKSIVLFLLIQGNDI